MESSMPQARLSVVEGAGHAVHLEQPAAFASLVAEFLDLAR
jgi:pimeloyl-ACP methyl ester carboxylesterase